MKEDQQETMEPGDSDPRDSAGKPCKVEARAIDGPPETGCLPGPWQIKPDTWPHCLLALVLCKKVPGR